MLQKTNTKNTIWEPNILLSIYSLVLSYLCKTKIPRTKFTSQMLEHTVFSMSFSLFFVAVSYFTNVGLYIMMGGLMSSFLAGIIYDWQKNMCKGNQFKYLIGLSTR